MTPSAASVLLCSNEWLLDPTMSSLPGCFCGISQRFVFILCVIIFVALVRYGRRGWKPAGTAFGTATWASEKLLRARGFFGGRGLILGRTFGGALIRLPVYTHTLLVGGTGSGKGVSIIIPNLLSYFRGSVICFDTKGDLYATASRVRAAHGQRIIRLAPFNGGTDCLNPLSTIPADSPTLVDSAKALSEALVVRTGTEPDPHWNDKASQLISALIVLVLRVFKEGERNLNSVQEIASDPELVKAAAQKLRELGGIPARLGNQIKGTLFDKETMGVTKEGAGILSTVSRHLSWLDSELVARCVASSTFDPKELQKPGITLFLQIPPGQLEAQRGLLRCILTTLIRVIGESGDEKDGEVLAVIDEASALGSSLPAIEEALIRGRSAGLRLLLAYQSDSQVTDAFRAKPTLLYDNCTTHIYLGASSLETAERLHKSLGEWTQVIDAYSTNESTSWQQGNASQPGSSQSSRGSSMNYSQTGRALLRIEDILTQSEDVLIAMLRGMSPILAQRVKWYSDPDFNPAIPRPKQLPTLLRRLLAAIKR